MYLLIVFLPLLGSSVAGFFGRFLGSEGTAQILAWEILVLCGIVLFLSSILLRLFRVSLTKQYGKGLVLVIHTCLLFLIALYLGFIRFYIIPLLSIFILGLIVSNEGGVICSMVSGNGASSGANSGWTSILGQGDGSASSVNQPTPSNSTQAGSASETGENLMPPSPGELQKKKEEFNLLVLRQFLHFCDRGRPKWQINTSDEESVELARVCVRDIINSLEIEDSVSEYKRWITHVRKEPDTLHILFNDYKTKRI